ncbi:MAG: ABC transporter substrate-binding protein [Burkholderiales bacterium PBB5]|nr:MAG: ABC transporter substrate-binding protein [Burkholderiales bacterium PBB5]
MLNLRRRTWAGLLATWGASHALRAEPAPLVVGQIGPFTGIPVPDAPQLHAGLQAAFGQVNARGGIAGRRISLFQLDDTYTGDGFVRAFAQAMARQPLALLCPVGSVALKRMLDDKLLDQADVLVLNAIPGAEALRNPGHPKLFHVRAGDRQQIDKIVAHARTLGISQLSVLHQDTPIGTSGLAMAREAAARLGGVSLSAVMATIEANSLGAAAARLAQSGTQAVVVLGAPRFMADGVAALRSAGVGQFIFALSYVPAGLLAKVAGAGARGVALAQTYPNPMGANLPLQRDFQAAMKASAPELTAYTSFHLEGYISARLFVEAARRARALTPDGLAAALHALGEVDLGGFRVNFSQSNVGSNFVDIGVVNADGRLVY